MKSKKHSYAVKVEWTGNLGEGTSNYKAYTRNHEISLVQTAIAKGRLPYIIKHIVRVLLPIPSIFQYIANPRSLLSKVRSP